MLHKASAAWGKVKMLHKVPVLHGERLNAAQSHSAA